MSRHHPLGAESLRDAVIPRCWVESPQRKRRDVAARATSTSQKAPRPGKLPRRTQRVGRTRSESSSHFAWGAVVARRNAGIRPPSGWSPDGATLQQAKQFGWGASYCREPPRATSRSKADSRATRSPPCVECSAAATLSASSTVLRAALGGLGARMLDRELASRRPVSAQRPSSTKFSSVESRTSAPAATADLASSDQFVDGSLAFAAISR